MRQITSEKICKTNFNLRERLQASLQQTHAKEFALGPLLQQVVHQRAWTKWTDSNGIPFADLASFVIHPKPQGLGVKDEEAADLLKVAMCKRRLYREWTEILERIIRTPGRPRKTCINGDIFEPFYTLNRAPNGFDRTLLRLKKEEPALFQRVCNGEMSPNAAANEAGWRKPVTSGSLRGQMGLDGPLSAEVISSLSAEQRKAAALQLIETLAVRLKMEIFYSLQHNLPQDLGAHNDRCLGSTK